MYRRPILYCVWQSMLDRCSRKKNKSYRNYGGRGISVCERWRNSFSAFVADMGPRKPGMTLDRYPNNDGNYEPSNCRWATRKEQAQNKRPYPFKNWAGKQFGRWLVLGPAGKLAGKRRLDVLCLCGTRRTVYTTHLVSGRSNSCGCLHRERVSQSNRERKY